MSLVQVMCPQD
jgi:hypothetical protein